MKRVELREIFTMQKGLDQHIEQNRVLENENLFERKILALLVEMGELANETRCFKFWSLKPSSPQAVILEEFVDGIHFLLSLGLDCGFEHIHEITAKQTQVFSMSEQFLQVYEKVTIFRADPSLEAYKNMFSQYLVLANMLGFSDEEIKQAYILKNEVNYKRQQEGY